MIMKSLTSQNCCMTPPVSSEAPTTIPAFTISEDHDSLDDDVDSGGKKQPAQLVVHNHLAIHHPPPRLASWYSRAAARLCPVVVVVDLLQQAAGAKPPLLWNRHPARAGSAPPWEAAHPSQGEAH